jgi:hypothetical protein
MCDSLPWEGVGRGFIDRLICFKWRINPSLPLRNPAAPLPREGIKNLPNTYGVVSNNPAPRKKFYANGKKKLVATTPTTALRTSNN